MGSLTINGSTSGQVTIAAPAVAGTNTLTLPAATGTVITTASSAALPVSAISATGTPSASTFLRGDSSWAAVSVSGGLIRTPQFLTSGTSYTTPAGCNAIYLEMLGGGGGGGGVQAAGQNRAGCGGGAAFGNVYITVTPSTTYTISIGAAGSAGASGGGSGGAGGNTSITVGATTYTAGGGGGGTGNSGTSGAGGTASNLPFSFAGKAGDGPGSGNYSGGFPYYIYLPGQGTANGSGNSNGSAASFYGCGGGAAVGQGGTAYSGGAGSQGYMRIWEFT